MKAATAEIRSLLEGTHHHPHQFLGMHPHTQGDQTGVIVRAFIQDAISCQVVDIGSEGQPHIALKQRDERGFFEGFLADRSAVFDYRLSIEQPNGEIREFYDPYAFLPTLSDQDLYLFNEGTDRQVYHKLGAHERTINGVPGVSFAVWAPGAKRVSVTGDFNNWDGRYHPMRSWVPPGFGSFSFPVCGLEHSTNSNCSIITAISN